MLRVVVLIVLFLASLASAGPIIITDEVLEEIDFSALFSPETQAEYIQDGYIDIGPYTYSVFDDYTFTDRQRIWQECQKWADLETLLYVDQYLIGPIYEGSFLFPMEEYPLFIEAPAAVDVPSSLSLLFAAAVLLPVVTVGAKRVK